MSCSPRGMDCMGVIIYTTCIWSWNCFCTRYRLQFNSNSIIMHLHFLWNREELLHFTAQYSFFSQDLKKLMHARIQKVLTEGVQVWRRILVDEGREDPNTTKSGPQSDVDCPTLNADLIALWFFKDRTSIAKNPYSFVIFQVGGVDTLSPSGSAHVMLSTSCTRSCITSFANMPTYTLHRAL